MNQALIFLTFSLGGGLGINFENNDVTIVLGEIGSFCVGQSPGEWFKV